MLMSLLLEIVFNEYNNKTAPLKEFYTQQNKLQSIEGVGSIDAINAKLCEAIDQL